MESSSEEKSLSMLLMSFIRSKIFSQSAKKGGENPINWTAVEHETWWNDFATSRIQFFFWEVASQDEGRM